MNESFVKVLSNSDMITDQIHDLFTFEIPDAHFKKQKKNGKQKFEWDGKIRLYKCKY